jgi:hypothetical protein
MTMDGGAVWPIVATALVLSSLLPAEAGGITSRLQVQVGLC